MLTEYLVVFAQVHHEFRIPELTSVAELHGFTVTLPEVASFDTTRPFMKVLLEDEEHVRILARRCILIKSIYVFYAQGSSYDDLHVQNRINRHLWSRYATNTSFRFLVSAFRYTISQEHQIKVMESFDYMNFLGKIEMKHPEITLGCFEEYDAHPGDICGTHKGGRSLRQVYFGRLVEEGSARSLIKKFDVKQRAYFGNTSMDAEISLLMANQALAAPGKLIYDPFVGTGSLLYVTAHFGAQVFGSDIDGRQMRGKGKSPGVIRAASQYSVASRVLDLCTFDVTRNPLRCGELFDAIVTDPPYGVRAGAKRLGRKKEPSALKQAAYHSHLSSPRPDDQPYIPPTRPYELSHLAADLVLLARYLLKTGGRLVFFLPTVTDEYEELDICSMLCEGMEVIGNSFQDFGNWGRRLVTIRKITTVHYPPPSFDTPQQPANDKPEIHVPAHKDFRVKYFQGFKRDDEESTSC